MISIRETRLSPSDATNKLDVAQLPVIVGQRAALVLRHVPIYRTGGLREERGGCRLDFYYGNCCSSAYLAVTPPWRASLRLPACHLVSPNRWIGNGCRRSNCHGHPYVSFPLYDRLISSPPQRSPWLLPRRSRDQKWQRWHCNGSIAVVIGRRKPKGYVACRGRSLV